MDITAGFEPAVPGSSPGGSTKYAEAHFVSRRNDGSEAGSRKFSAENYL